MIASGNMKRCALWAISEWTKTYGRVVHVTACHGRRTHATIIEISSTATIGKKMFVAVRYAYAKKGFVP